MRLHHSPTHWILVILVLLALLLLIDDAHGQTPVPASPTQSMGAAGMFQGRPEMAGAQAGLGAEAGPPQGGIGVQGPQDAERPLHLRPPSAVTAHAAALPPPQIAAAASASAQRRYGTRRGAAAAADRGRCADAPPGCSPAGPRLRAQPPQRLAQAEARRQAHAAPRPHRHLADRQQHVRAEVTLRQARAGSAQPWGQFAHNQTVIHRRGRRAGLVQFDATAGSGSRTQRSPLRNFAAAHG